MTLIPSISFNESNVGVTPVIPGVRNRIGIVSQFSRGPANTPTFITGFSDFATRYGSDTNIGSLAYQAAYDQGAQNFMLLRVLGNPQSASGQVTFSGVASEPNTLYFNIKFIGNIQEITAIESVINITGQYTGVISGRYYFYVSSITAQVATILYTFVPLATDVGYVSNWSSITTSISVNLSSDHGIIKSVANGVSIAFGEPGDTVVIPLNVGDSFKVRTSSYVFEIPINTYDTPSMIATSFINTVTGLEPFGTVNRDTADTGVIFTLASTINGAIGNKYSYYFELANTTSPGITTSNPALLVANSLFMTGGTDGPRNAVLDLYTINSIPLLRLFAVSEGTWGNQLRVTIYPLSNSQFTLSVYDLNVNNYNPITPAESYTLDFSNLDPNGYLVQLANSNYIRGLFLPQYNNPNNFDLTLLSQSPQRSAPSNSAITNPTDPANPTSYGSNFLTDLVLTNGYDGPPITDQDYITGLDALASQPVHILLCPGVTSPAVQASMIAHAEAAVDKDGLRIAILSANAGLVANAAFQQTVGLNTERGVKVVGWSTYAGQTNTTRFSLPPDVLYAGKLAAIPFYVGPNARTTAGPIYNITEVDSIPYSSAAALQLYTNANLEVLTIDSSSQGYVFTNGITLSSNPSWTKIYLRRTYDMIRMDLFDMISQYLGEPHTITLRNQIASAINGYLANLSSNGQIANYQNAICDSTNNSPTNYISGQLNITISFLPLYSADYITITMIRDTQDGLVSYGS